MSTSTNVPGMPRGFRRGGLAAIGLLAAAALITAALILPVTAVAVTQPSVFASDFQPEEPDTTSPESESQAPDDSAQPDGDMPADAPTPMPQVAPAAATAAATATATPVPTATAIATARPASTQVESASFSCSTFAWDPATWGAEHSSAGTHLTFDEIARQRATNGSSTVVGYRAGVTGVASGTALCLLIHRLDKPSQLSTTGLRVNDAGMLVISSSGAPVQVALNSFMMGEPLDIALVSTDGNLKAFSTVVPFPIQAIGPSTCRLAAVLGSSDGALYQIIGTGFEPNEKLDGFSRSESEQLKTEVHADAAGTWRVALQPAVIGKSGGTASFEAVGSKCDVKVTYDWGSALKVQ